MYWFIGCDMTETYGTTAHPAKDAVSGVVLDTGTVTWVLKDESGTAVVGGSGTATNSGGGVYTVIIDKAVTVLLAEGTTYILWMTFNQGNYDDFRRTAKAAKYRGAE